MRGWGGVGPMGVGSVVGVGFEFGIGSGELALMLRVGADLTSIFSNHKNMKLKKILRQLKTEIQK